MPKADADHNTSSSLTDLIARSATLGEILSTTILDATASHRLNAELAVVDCQILRTQALEVADVSLKLELLRESLVILDDGDWPLSILDSALRDLRSGKLSVAEH